MAHAALISWFDAIGIGDRETVGGKGGSLGEMTRAGITVPPGFVVCTASFERFLQALEETQPIRSLIEALDPEDLPAMTAICAGIRARLEAAPLPDDLDAAIRDAHASLISDGAGDPVAVRSSATTEDAADASFAGLQDTYLWVKGATETAAAVRRCWASLYSVESVGYRLKHALPESGVQMAVVVQRMVDARSAGVMFTRSPTTGDRSVITIETSWGLGSAVVGGEVTPDRFVISKITGEVSQRTISDKAIEHLPAPEGGTVEVPVDEARRKAPSVSDDELWRLAEVAKRIERHYRKPQDIEFAVDRRSGEIMILQSRPETVWATRDQAPVARPAASPMDHVLNLFGGRK
jgi:pyruvate,water dikinase